MDESRLRDVLRRLACNSQVGAGHDSGGRVLGENMKRTVMFTGLLSSLLVVCSNSIWSTSQEEEQSRPALAKAVTGAKISLEEALTTVMREGEPLSARFEIEDGRLQLSVYRVKDGQFAEVIIEPDTGAVAEVDPITSGGDYTVAQNRNAVMAKAKRSLREAVEDALGSNPGFRAVRAVPAFRNGHPVAEITLTKGSEWKKVHEKLD